MVVLVCLLGLLFGSESWAQQNYQKSTEGQEVVLNKIYSKRNKLELSGGVGFILNQSYIETTLLGAGLSYYFSEEWGASFDFAMASNNDKPERGCIENFYNDPDEEVGAPCGGPDLLSGTKNANYGPAYVPIREISNILTANVVWNPVYGKQLVLLSTTSYFDLFVEGGLSLVGSKFYAKQTTLNNGNPSRGDFQIDPNTGATLPNQKIGAAVTEEDSYGLAGRPLPEDQSNIAINLGVGQKFHFAKRFQLKMYLRNMTILGTEAGFENLFALYLGLGVRF